MPSGKDIHGRYQCTGGELYDTGTAQCFPGKNIAGILGVQIVDHGAGDRRRPEQPNLAGNTVLTDDLYLIVPPGGQMFNFGMVFVGFYLFPGAVIKAAAPTDGIGLRRDGILPSQFQIIVAGTKLANIRYVGGVRGNAMGTFLPLGFASHITTSCYSCLAERACMDWNSFLAPEMTKSDSQPREIISTPRSSQRAINSSLHRP